MELSDWFKGFEKGMEKLPQEQRANFFSECSRNCMDCGPIEVYRKLYADSKGDLDAFFIKANELAGVKGEIVEKGRVYHLFFLACTCVVARSGHVTTPVFCECSRQSVIYSLQSLWKEKRFKVTLCHSILQGKQNCKMRIEVV